MNEVLFDGSFSKEEGIDVQRCTSFFVYLAAIVPLIVLIATFFAC